MRKLILPLLFSIISSIVFSQTAGPINGKITDKQTNVALRGATVTIKGTQASSVTNDEGDFIFQKVNVGKIILVITYVGYETIELTTTIKQGQPNVANAALSIDERIGSEVVVSASKRPEKITNAPASIQVIGAKDFSQFAGSNVGELVSKVQGIEYSRNGVTDITFNARGFHSAFNNKVFQLVDGRNSMSPLSASLPVMNRGTFTKDDIERLEIIVGPQTALYGPNAHNALFNYITKDPRKYPGTTVSISAGSRYQFSGRIRQAAKISGKWAYKLTGEYVTGKEYDFKDSVYAGNQPPSTYEGNEPPPGTTPYYGPPVTIPERISDFNFRHIRGEGHVYYSVTPIADFIISVGGSKNSWPQVTTSGRNQMRDVSYSFVQARFVSPRFFANIYDTWGSFGSSYGIANYTRDYWNRTHSTLTSGPNRYLPPDSAEIFALRNIFKEENYRINAEVQYNYQFEKIGLFLVTGMNYQKEMPNGFGISLIDSFQRIKITQYGGVMQLEKKLPWDMRFIATARLDHHSNFGNFAAPRFAVTKGIKDVTFRMTWGKAYAMPSIQQQYAGINRSLFGNGGVGVYYIPVGTNIHDTSLFKTTTPLKPEQVETWEVGFKGIIAKKLYIDISYYSGLSENFISPTRTVRGRVMTVNGTEVTHNPSSAGTVILDTLRNASFSTFFNYAEVRGYGLDLGVTYTFNKFISLTTKYSWFNSDITNEDIKNDANNDGYVSLEETSLNAPNHRGVVILNLQNLCKGRMFINLSVRFVQQYDFYSSSQIGTEAGEGSRGKVYLGINPINSKHRWALKNFDWGPLGGFTTIDLSAGYRVNQMLQVNMGITNLFDTEQIEFVGSPSIGRLFMFELRVHVPNKKD